MINTDRYFTRNLFSFSSPDHLIRNHQGAAKAHGLRDIRHSLKQFAVKMLKLAPLFLILIMTGCGNGNEQNPASLEEKINQLIEQDRYEDALQLLADENTEDSEVRLLLEKTYLNYGLKSMNTFEAGEMRTRMNNALIQFVEVLKINPENDVAKNQIDQILGVYNTMPNRSPEPEAVEALRKVGINP